MNVELMNATQIRKKIEELDVFLNNPKNFDKPNFYQLKNDRKKLETRIRELDRNGLFELNC